MFTFINSVFLPIVLSATVNASAPVTVTGHTSVYSEGATCVIKQSGIKQTVTADADLWCDYGLIANQAFSVEVTEVSSDPNMPGPVWAFTCTAADVSEEYPQAIYGPGCKH